MMLRGLYPYGSALTRPVTILLRNRLAHAHCSRAYTLKVSTPWLPPGGSCQTALRNRLTDEGRRTVGQEMQLDERYMFQIVPFNREIQNF